MKEEAESVISEGNRQRSVGRTDMNAESSRSHAIFTCWIERHYGAGTESGGGASVSKSRVTVGKLNLVDLAGSERGAKTGATGARAKEGDRHVPRVL